LKLPVAIVAGFAGAGKSALIERWLRERPVGERWALLGNAPAAGASGGAGTPGMADGPAMADGPTGTTAGTLGFYRVAGGCACCTAQASARSALVALLRAGPWHRLVVELDGAARPQALIDLLRSPPFDALLEVDDIVSVVDATRPAPFEAEPMHPLAQAQVEVATRIELNQADRLPEPRRAALVRRLASAPPFGRAVEMPGTATSEASGAGLSPRAAAPPAAVVPPAAAEPPAACWRRPADQVFDRARLQALAAGWPSRHRLVQGTGVFRTARDWYLWRFDDAVSAWEACAYRLENRLQLAVPADTPAEAAAAALASIAADLEQAVNRDRDEA